MRTDSVTGICRWPWLALVAALPFHVPRPFYLGTGGPSLSAPELWAPVALLALVLGAPRRAGQLRRVIVPFALVLVPLALVALVGAQPLRASLDVALLFYMVLLYAGGAVVATEGARSAGLRALVGGAAVACALGLVGVALAWGGIDAPWAHRYRWMVGTPRPLGPTESPSMLAMVALAGLAATVILRRASALTRGAAALLGGLFVTTLVLSQSRVALGAATFGAVLFHGGAAQPVRRAFAVGVVAVALAATLASVTFRLVPYRARWPFVDTHASPYAACHTIAWRALAAHPLVGVGLGGFETAWPTLYDARLDAAFDGESFRDTPLEPHGTLHEYAAEAGVVGLAVIAALAWLVCRRRDPSVPELIPYLAALALCGASIDLFHERTTWALLGLLSATANANANATAVSRPDASRAA